MHYNYNNPDSIYTTIIMWDHVTPLWFGLEKLKSELSASPKEMECCDPPEQERNVMWPASLQK